MECEKCSETDNVKEFAYFENRPDEFLCWDCRFLYIERRLTGGEYDEEGESESSGQTNFGEFQ